MHKKNGNGVDTIRIVVVDDHRIFRDGLCKLLAMEADFRVVAETGDGEHALELVRELHPDVLLLDLAMHPDGLDVLRKLADEPFLAESTNTFEAP